MVGQDIGLGFNCRICLGIGEDMVWIIPIVKYFAILQSCLSKPLYIDENDS